MRKMKTKAPVKKTEPMAELFMLLSFMSGLFILLLSLHFIHTYRVFNEGMQASGFTDVDFDGMYYDCPDESMGQHFIATKQTKQYAGIICVKGDAKVSKLVVNIIK